MHPKNSNPPSSELEIWNSVFSVDRKKNNETGTKVQISFFAV